MAVRGPVEEPAVPGYVLLHPGAAGAYRLWVRIGMVPTTFHVHFAASFLNSYTNVS